MQGFKWIYDTFGSSGIFATILLMRFPKILTGAFSILKGVVSGGLKSLFSARGATPTNPMFVSDVAGGPGVSGADFAGRSKGGVRGKFSTGQYMRSGVKNMAKGNFLKGGSRLLKGVGKAAGPLALLSAGMDLFGNLTDSNLGTGDALLKTLDQNKFTALGAGIGALFGGVGAIPGAAIGGLIDMFAGEWGTYGKNKQAKPKRNVANYYGNVMMDGSVSPKGNVIKTAKGEIWHTSPKDYIFASQPGKGGRMGGGNIKIDVSGTIKLDGISDNLLDKMTPAEKNALAKMVISRMKTQNT